MMTRRTLLVASAGAATLSAFPALAWTEKFDLVIADPQLLRMPPVAGVLTARGPELFATLLPRLQDWRSIYAVVTEADLRLLAELVRFSPRLRWQEATLGPDTNTPAGRLGRVARVAIARRSA